MRIPRIGLLAALVLALFLPCSALAEADIPLEAYSDIAESDEGLSDAEIDAMIALRSAEYDYDDGEPAMIIDSKIHSQIVSALGDERVTQTYDHLKGGHFISPGDKDAKLRGLQVLLNIMDGNLTVDGSIGEKSFEHLRAMQEAFGMPPAGRVGREEFEEILVNAYIVRDPITAGSLLGPEHDRQVRYVLGALNELRGKYYSAKKQFDTLSAYKDGAGRAANCVRPWPENGVLQRGEGFGTEDCRLIVQTSRPREMATYLKIFRSGKLVCSLFIAGTREVSVVLPKGTYSFRAAVGSTWFGPIESFGVSDNSFYQQLTFQGSKESVEFKRDKMYTLTLGGATENNVDTRSISASDFG